MTYEIDLNRLKWSIQNVLMICILILRLQSHINYQFPKQVSWPQGTQTLGLHALISNPPLDKLMFIHQVLIMGNLKQKKCLLPLSVFFKGNLLTFL